MFFRSRAIGSLPDVALLPPDNITMPCDNRYRVTWEIPIHARVS